MPPKARRYCLDRGLFGNPQMFAGELGTSHHSQSQFTTQNPHARLVLRQNFHLLLHILLSKYCFCPRHWSPFPAPNTQAFIVQLSYLEHGERGWVVNYYFISARWIRAGHKGAKGNYHIDETRTTKLILHSSALGSWESAPSLEPLTTQISHPEVTKEPHHPH